MKKYTKWIFVLLWMILIFYLSNEPGSISTETSQFFVSKLEKILKIIPIFSNELIWIVRKSAHFVLYFILGMLMMYAMNGKKKDMWITLLFCLLYACSDEIHQLFVVGRNGNIKDVCIDFMGSLFGVYLMKWVSRGCNEMK